jgi:beta-N-acetylhexosaminidase
MWGQARSSGTERSPRGRSAADELRSSPRCHGVRQVTAVGALGLSIAVVVSSLAATAGASGSRSSPSLPAASGATATSPCQDVVGSRSGWVSCMLDHMTTAEKVAQMFMINVYGTSATDTTPANVAANEALYGAGVATPQDVINTYHPGGVIYFTWSNGLTSPSQVVTLSNGIQQAALAQPTPAPMLISADQEEGWIVRIGSPATVFPGNMAVGATGSTTKAYNNSSLTGLELRAMGVNVDNAPVVDTNVNPKNTSDGVRSYGDRPAVVSRFAKVAVRGFQGPGRVGAVAKHFPGLGDTTTNPDDNITSTDQTLADMERDNFPSFKAAIAAGVDEVMVTHIVAEKITHSDVPSSLSPYFVTDLLRDQLGFRGVIVTDAMNAAALNAYSPAQAAVMAVEAGEDLLLYAQQAGATPGSDFVAGYNAVLDAVNSGQISLSRIEASDKRILTLKWKLGLAKNPMTNPNAQGRLVGTAAHLAVARRTAEDSITVVKNSDHVLPLHLRRGASVLVTGYGSTGIPVVAHDIASRGLTTRALPIGTCPTADQISQAVAAAKDSGVIIVDTWNVWDTSACTGGTTPQIDLVNALVATGKRVVVAAVGTPYDAAYLRSAPAFVATYDPQPVSLDAMVAVLFGDAQPKGHLPVTITKPSSKKVLYPFGWGLSYSG